MDINKIDKYFKTLQKHLGCESFTYNVSEGFKVKLKPLSNKEDVLVVLQLRQRSEALPVEDRTELSYSYLYMNLVLSKAGDFHRRRFTFKETKRRGHSRYL
jgi:hypothetical protein